MKELRKGEQLKSTSSEMGQRALLRSSKDVLRYTFSDFEEDDKAREELFARLAELIVETYFHAKNTIE